MKGPADRELTAYERRHIRETGARGRVAGLAGKLREARRQARRKLSQVRRDQHARHDKRARKVEFRPGQLVYRKQMVRGRKLDPKWVGPYRVIQKVTDLVYRVQMGKGEANLHVEQLKLCRTSREELREKRKQHRRRMREQRPARECDDGSDTETESGDYENPPRTYEPYERRETNDADYRVGRNPPSGGETEIERESEQDGASEAGDGRSRGEAIGLSGDRHGYSLRPRVPRNYKE
jgi:hypothetical protein